MLEDHQYGYLRELKATQQRKLIAQIAGLRTVSMSLATLASKLRLLCALPPCPIPRIPASLAVPRCPMRRPGLCA